MRSPRAPAWARSAVFAFALLCAVAGLTSNANAQAKFDRLFVFGDSYADLTLSDRPASNPLAPPGLSLPVWRVYPVPLGDNLGKPEMIDFAVGGATVSPDGSPAVPPLLNLPDQVKGFIDANAFFGPRDLVTLSIGGNDFLQLFATSGKDPVTFGTDTAKSATDEVHKLVERGARTFVIAGFSGMSNLGVIPDPAKAAADAYASAYFNAMQANLLSDAQKGVRFFMLDLFRLGEQAVTDPRYGFTVTKFDQNGKPIESRCPGGGLACGGTIDSPEGNKYVLGPDGLHLTNGGFELVADYMANQVLAPDTIAVQPGIVMSTTSAFTGSVLGRLDAMRDQRDAAGYLASANAGGPMGLGYGDGSRARPTGPSSRLTAYTMGTFAGGSRSDSFEQVGFDYEAPSGTVGLEYSVNRNLLVGLAGNYTATNADLNATNADLNNGAAMDVHALQAAAYISYATRQLFAEALVGYGHHDLDLARRGVIDTVRSSTDANTFAAAARGAYLFDFGGLRAGPIAGLTYIHARVDGYTERGDELLTFNVSTQTQDSLTGNVGVQFRTQFLAGGNLVSPFVNVTLEHQFGDNTRTLTLDQVQTDLFVPIFTPVPNFDTRTYGRVEGGVTFQIGPAVSATVNAASTFARDEGNDYRISTGLNYRF